MDEYSKGKRGSSLGTGKGHTEGLYHRKLGKRRSRNQGSCTHGPSQSPPHQSLVLHGTGEPITEAIFSLPKRTAKIRARQRSLAGLCLWPGLPQPDCCICLGLAGARYPWQKPAIKTDPVVSQGSLRVPFVCATESMFVSCTETLEPLPRSLELELEKVV